MTTIPPNCPFCKSEPTYVSERSGTYACHTSIHIVYDDTHISQPTECIRRERGRLAARVADLEEELESHAWKISPAMAQAKIDQLNGQVSSWKLYAERLEIAGDTMAQVTLRNGRSHEQWHAAKETTP